MKPFAITLAVGSSLANKTGAWRTERPVYVDRMPPCNDACPAGENVQRWLYQHSWIVTGARFGWWHGDQALVKLIAVDRRIEHLWGIGRKSEVVARAALKHVRRKQR